MHGPCWFDYYLLSLYAENDAFHSHYKLTIQLHVHTWQFCTKCEVLQQCLRKELWKTKFYCSDN